MADAVVAVTIFHQHFPSTLAMECDGERDRGIFFMFDAPGFLFPYLVHFLLSSSRVAQVDAYLVSRSFCTPLVSGECRLAIVLYRAYPTPLKRCAGGAGKGRSARRKWPSASIKPD